MVDFINEDQDVSKRRRSRVWRSVVTYRSFSYLKPPNRGRSFFSVIDHEGHSSNDDAACADLSKM
jgi:hypothetical protein